MAERDITPIRERSSDARRCVTDDATGVVHALRDEHPRESIVGVEWFAPILCDPLVGVTDPETAVRRRPTCKECRRRARFHMSDITPAAQHSLRGEET
jgi:hypothetical protein